METVEERTATHTPLPWHVEAQTDYSYGIFTATGAPVATALSKGDAALIVRAVNSFPALEQLLVAAERVKQMKFDRYKKGNGHEAGIQADDGEKCWIVHSDEISALEFAIDDARAAITEATGGGK